MDIKEYHDCYFDCYFQLLTFEKNFRQFTQSKVGNGDLTLASMMILSYLHVNGSCGQKELTVTFNAECLARTDKEIPIEAEKGETDGENS